MSQLNMLNDFPDEQLSGSRKTEVIRALYRDRLLSGGEFDESRALVTLNDVVEAIAQVNDRFQLAKPISGRNPSNFWKDFSRIRSNLIRNWPVEVRNAGYFAESAKSDPQGCFRFRAYDPERDSVEALGPSDDDRLNTVVVQTLSLSRGFLSVSSSDESRVTSVMERLHVLETHFANTRPSKALNVSALEFLQSNVKLQPGEVDALWVGSVPNAYGDMSQWLVAAEVKGRRDDLDEDQIVDQISALRRSAHHMEKVAGIIPVAVKLTGPSELFVLEYEHVPKDAPDVGSIRVAHRSLIALNPLIRGLK